MWFRNVLAIHFDEKFPDGEKCHPDKERLVGKGRVIACAAPLHRLIAPTPSARSRQ